MSRSIDTHFILIQIAAGFVYIKSDSDKQKAPGLSEVRKAAQLLEKPKKAQDVHPLFCRGFDTTLNMNVSEEGIVVTVKTNNDQLVVMDHPMHKVVFVVAVKRTVFVVAKHNLRGKGIMFKCHGFRVKASEVAKSLSQDIALTCNYVFRKLFFTVCSDHFTSNTIWKMEMQLRQTRSFVRSQRESRVNAPATPSTKTSDDIPMRNKGDPDTRELRKLIAQTRISILQGNDAVHDISAEDEANAERMLCGPEPEVHENDDISVVQEIIKHLQQSIFAIDAACESQLQEDDTEKLVSIPKDQPSQGASSDEGDEQEDALEIDEEKFQAQLIDYDEFSDDFARMTLYLHGDSGKKKRSVPKYAEVTLDSDLFDQTSVA
eukprot:gene8721-1107_t